MTFMGLEHFCLSSIKKHLKIHIGIMMHIIQAGFIVIDSIITISIFKILILKDRVLFKTGHFLRPTVLWASKCLMGPSPVTNG